MRWFARIGWGWAAALCLFVLGAGTAVHAQGGPGEIPYWATMNRPADAPLAVPQFDRLQSQLQQAGATRVIVRFKEAAESFAAEGELSSPAAVQKQRGAIKSKGDQLLQRLPAAARQKAKRFDHIPFMALEVDESGFLDLLNAPEIDFIEEDIPVPPSLSKSVPLVGSDGNGLFSGYSGAGQTVAILDTGVEKTHSFLSGKVVEEACYSTTYLASGVTSLCPNGSTEQVGAGAGADCSTAIGGCGHGTHVAGIAAGKGAGSAGVAQDASIIAIQVFSKFTSSCSGSSPCAMSYTSDQIKALSRVYELRNTYNIAAVNMSLGGGSHAAPCDGTQSSIKAAIDQLRSVGIATIIASGNNGYTGYISGPACVSTAVSVGATTKADALATYSNSVSWLSLLAPGSAIESSTKGGGFASWNGTSMATPHVAGAWAVIKSKKPNATVDEVLTALQSTGQPVIGKGVTRPRIKVDSALATIIPDARLRFSSATYLVSEGAGNAVIAVRREGPTEGAASVSWSTSGGTATAGSDYVSGSGTVSFADGEGGEKTFQVQIVDDANAEPSKTVQLTLSSPVGNAFLVSPSSATLTVVDDDQAAGTITVPLTSSNGVYTVTWAHTAPAGTWYELQEATDPDFLTARTVFNGTVPGWTVSGQSNGEYYYRVRTVHDAGTASGWGVGGNPCTVTMAVVALPSSLTAPAASSSGKYSVVWGASATAGVTYELWEATDAGFTEDLHLVYRGTGKSAALTKTENDTLYYRVRAVKAGSSPGEWRSAGNPIVVTLACGAPATITVPASNSTGLYTVSWKASNIAGSTYTLEQAKDAAFTVGLTTVYTGTAVSAKLAVSEDATYYYRVKASKTGFATSAWKTGTGCAVVLTCGLPASISYPKTSSNGSYLVKWGKTSVIGATYTVEEATNSSFTTGLRTVYTGTALQTEVSGLSNGSYYYRVKASRAGYATSANKAGLSACVVSLASSSGTAGPVVPAASSTGLYTITWNSSGQTGVSYELQEATNSGFTANLRQAYKGTGLKATISVFQNSTYYYQVRATKSGSQPSAWVAGGNGAIVTMPSVPAFSGLTVPSANSTGSALITWNKTSLTGVSYELQEATDSGFTTGVRTAYKGSALKAAVKYLTNGTYYYRVRAFKAGYNATGWVNGGNSSSVALACGAPGSMTVPSSNTTGAVVLKWTASNIPAVIYKVEKATNSSFTAGVEQVYEGKGLTVTVPIVANGTFYFRVRATRINYSDSDWRAGGNACTVGPVCGAPASITYPKTDGLGSIKVSWGASNIKGVTYELERDTDPGFSTPEQVYQGLLAYTFVTVGENGTYYYRVRATKAGYNSSSWVKTVGPYSCAVTLAAPASASLTVPKSNLNGIYVLSWKPSKLAGSYYALEESTASNFSDAKIIYVGPEVKFTVSGKGDGTFYYRVKAFKAGYAESAWKAGANGCLVNVP